MDFEPLKLYYFLQENKFDFPIYHFGGDWVMAGKHRLLSFPHCMFIDKKGNYINYLAASPSRNAEVEFIKNRTKYSKSPTRNWQIKYFQKVDLIS